MFFTGDDRRRGGSDDALSALSSSSRISLLGEGLEAETLESALESRCRAGECGAECDMMIFQGVGLVTRSSDVHSQVKVFALLYKALQDTD